jgi:cystathionine gamma-synthase
MTDLLKQPLWREGDLGLPLPDHDFGVSVCLPLWRHVIGYEEKDPEIVAKFRSGYPRFCCPPAVGALFDAATREFASEGERCLVFPKIIHARRCQEWLEREKEVPRYCERGYGEVRVAEMGDEKLGVVIFPEAAYARARLFWRFSGEVVSTRQASEALGEVKCDATAADGAAAQCVIRERLALLSGQGAEEVFLFPSGMAANFAVHRMLMTLLPGRKTVQLDFPYVDVLKLQESFGSGAHFLPVMDEAGYARLDEVLRDEKIAGLFCEAPSNPLLRCVDFSRVLASRRARQPDVPLIVDDTVASVVNTDAFRVADVVTTSLTKAFSGTGDVMAGGVIINRASPWHGAFLKFLGENADHELWRGDAVALERNSRDFAERVATMSRNAQVLCDHLRAHPKVARVHYADEGGGVGYEMIRREGGGHGCLFSIVLKNARETSPRFYDALRVCKGPSLGTNFTLACPYTLLAHYDELDQVESLGVDRHLIRVSAGLEDTADLIARFDEALAVA